MNHPDTYKTKGRFLNVLIDRALGLNPNPHILGMPDFFQKPKKGPISIRNAVIYM
jgi:hypothetical protein